MPKKALDRLAPVKSRPARVFKDKQGYYLRSGNEKLRLDLPFYSDPKRVQQEIIDQHKFVPPPPIHRRRFPVSFDLEMKHAPVRPEELGPAPKDETGDDDPGPAPKDEIGDNDDPGQDDAKGGGKKTRRRRKGDNTLYGDEIQDMMKKHPSFSGVFARDEVRQIRKMVPMGAIINLDKTGEPGSHWVALYISRDSVEYFDPLGEDPGTDIVADVMALLKRWRMPTMMKFKINKIKYQNSRSTTCGYHSMRFLMDRFNGKTFKFATGFDNSKQGEKKVKETFGLI